LRRAAETLNMSQPALSKSLRRLEKSAKAKLVKRTPKGVELTTVGAALLRHARQLTLYLDDVANEVLDLSRGHAGHLRIGVTPPYVENPVAQSCVCLLADSPKVTLNIMTGGHEVLLPALQKGELELNISGIATTAYKDLAQEHLFDDAFVVYASTDHPLAGRKRLTVADIAQNRWALAESNTALHQTLRRTFEDQGFSPPVVAMETPAVGPKFELVAASEVLGFTARRLLREAPLRLGLTELDVKGLPWLRPVNVIYRRDAYLSPVARRFIEILKTTAKGIATEKR
jgi:DNA-binding transcriptional LysR family regulator